MGKADWESDSTERSPLPCDLVPCTFPQRAQYTEIDTESYDHPMIQAKWELA